MKRVMIWLVILLCGITGEIFAQGIMFHKGTFEEAQQLAKEQNKLIFIDFHTVWCGPCKMLANNVFPQPEVGAYFNERFVNCKLDAEKEGRELAKKYNVSSYPSLVFVNDGGEMIHKVSGVVSAETLIEAGKVAVFSMNDPNSLVNLKKQYASKSNDEHYLKMYIAKMIDSKEKPYEAIEQYLKIQKDLEEGSSKMMEFLMNYSDYLLLGGEAERIYNENESEYMDIATSLEEKRLQQIRVKMMKLTQTMALQKGDVRLYELFIDRWLKLPEKPYYQDYNDLRLDLLYLKDEKKLLRQLGIVYLDSIVDSRSVEDIIEKDQKRYDDYCRTHPSGSWIQEAMREGYRAVDAKLQVKAILKVGGRLLEDVKRKDLKHFPKWIAHGKALMPDDYRIVDLEADMFYRKGDKKEAIELKRQILDRLKSTDKTYSTLENELKRMEEGTY